MVEDKHTLRKLISNDSHMMTLLSDLGRDVPAWPPSPSTGCLMSVFETAFAYLTTRGVPYIEAFDTVTHLVGVLF